MVGGRPGWFDAAVPERCYGVAVFVIYVASRCILRRGPSRVGLPDLDHPRLLRGGVFFDFMLHPVHLLHWKQLAGPNRCRLRLKLSKNEGVPSRTPYGECGEPLHEDWIFFVRH